MEAIRNQTIVGPTIDVDGFTFDAPDTPANQKSIHSNLLKPKELAFRVSGALDCLNGDGFADRLRIGFV